MVQTLKHEGAVCITGTEQESFYYSYMCNNYKNIKCIKQFLLEVVAVDKITVCEN